MSSGQVPYEASSYGQVPYEASSSRPSSSRQVTRGLKMTIVLQGATGSGKSECVRLLNDILSKLYNVLVISFDDIFFKYKGRMKQVIKEIKKLMHEVNNKNDRHTILVLDTCGCRSDSLKEFFGIQIINPVRFIPNIDSCNRNSEAFLQFCTENVLNRTGKYGLTSETPNCKNIIRKKYKALVDLGVYPDTNFSKEVSPEDLDQFKKGLTSLSKQVCHFLKDLFPKYKTFIDDYEMKNFR